MQLIPWEELKTTIYYYFFTYLDFVLFKVENVIFKVKLQNLNESASPTKFPFV